MTQSDIAKEVGLSPGGISDIANGRTREPSGDSALKLDRLHRQRCPRANQALQASIA